MPRNEVLLTVGLFDIEDRLVGVEEEEDGAQFAQPMVTNPSLRRDIFTPELEDAKHKEKVLK